MSELVRAFAAATLPQARWHHAEHIVVAVWYLVDVDKELEDRIDEIRQGIQRLNASHGVEQTPSSGYHESITYFLASGIDSYLGALPAAWTVEQRARRAISDFADFKADLHSYYHAETIHGWDARTIWVEPDRESLSKWLATCRERALIAGKESASER